MPAKPFQIETRPPFASKGDAHAFFKAMLSRYRPGERVSDEDARDLAALLKHHTDYAEKYGTGIDHFEVVAAEYGTQCFEITRTDGTPKTFSYPHCITPYRPKGNVAPKKV